MPCLHGSSSPWQQSVPDEVTAGGQTAVPSAQAPVGRSWCAPHRRLNSYVTNGVSFLTTNQRYFPVKRVVLMPPRACHSVPLFCCLRWPRTSFGKCVVGEGLLRGCAGSPSKSPQCTVARSRRSLPDVGCGGTIPEARGQSRLGRRAIHLSLSRFSHW